MNKIKNYTYLLLLFLLNTAFAAEPLAPEEAFKFDARVEGATIKASWTPASDYYIYKAKVRFESATPGITLGEPELPKGKIKHGIRPDGTEGDVETYTKTVNIDVPITQSSGGELKLIAISQGCAEELGICYPPQKREMLLQVAALGTNDKSQAVQVISDLGAQLGLDAGQDDQPLSGKEAFQMTSHIEGDQVVLSWIIADDYYMYRDKFSIKSETEGISFGAMKAPAGKMKHGILPSGKEGEVAVFFKEVSIAFPILASKAGINEIKFFATGQGCADSRGICYPPQRYPQKLSSDVSFAVNADTAVSTDSIQQPAVNKKLKAENPDAANTEYASDLTAQERFAKQLEVLFAEGNMMILLPALLGFGLLLAFTACMYPMIPIVSSIIVGQGEKITAARGFTLSFIYVLAVSITFGVVGAIMGFLGEKIGIQRWLQEPAVLYSFAALFIVLSLSMFGFYNIQVPSFIQSRLTEMSGKQQGGTLIGVGTMGVFSALIIGPCGGPILLAVMAGAAASNSMLFGFLYMSLLGFGMGLPLLLVGAGGGSLLPKAGTWMDIVKAVAGVILLIVALYLTSGIMNNTVYMLLWSTLLIVSAVYMGAFTALPDGVSGWRKLWKGLGLVMFVYGLIVMLGGITGARNVTDPLHGSKLLSNSNTFAPTKTSVASADAPAYVSFSQNKKTVIKGGLTFIKIKSVEDVRREVEAANKAGHTVMLDFYADWCVYCVKFDDYVFSAPEVQQALANTVLLQADITANDDEDTRLTKTLDVPLPPAILFFGLDGNENRAVRVTGFIEADKFSARIKRAFK